jgi:hypothetical protein
MKLVIVLLVSVLPLLCSAQIAVIKGYAPAYIGEEVSLFRYEDLLTNTELRIGSAKVGTDSVFTINVQFDAIEKVKLQVGKNFTHLYLQKDANYEIYFPESNKYEPVHPEGSEIEILFRTLPKTDINFKILEFDRWVNQFIGDNFHKRSSKSSDFAQNFDKLKMNMEKYYAPDTSVFFKTFVKFRLAELDDASFRGSRSEIERFDHYLLYSEVYYSNDAYMDYIKSFYKDFFERTSMELNNRIYLAILKSSPSLLMNALGQDYRMKNMRLRELIMIKGLGDFYYNADYPQTNISVMLDSLSKRALFASNQPIARNTHRLLTELMPGSPCPRFVLSDTSGDVTLAKFPGKYKYIQFVQKESVTGKNEMNLMVPMYGKYSKNVEFITVFFGEDNLDFLTTSTEYKSINWTRAIPKDQEELKKIFNIRTFPHYVLIDPDGFIVASPALRPSPDGQYETIDRTFFEIDKVMKKMLD